MYAVGGRGSDRLHRAGVGQNPVFEENGNAEFCGQPEGRGTEESSETLLATLLNVKVVVFPRPTVELSPFAVQVREASHH